MHTKDKLAAELRKIGLYEMAEKAESGYYDDFLSPLDFPEMKLAEDLAAVGDPEALALRQRGINGEFDATTEESDEWAVSEEGKATFEQLVQDAVPNTMEGAILLGSIAIRFVETQERRDAFMALMREAVSDIIEEATGQRPTWPEEPQPAPESERSGRG